MTAVKNERFVKIPVVNAEEWKSAQFLCCEIVLNYINLLELGVYQMHKVRLMKINKRVRIYIFSIYF